MATKKRPIGRYVAIAVGVLVVLVVLKNCMFPSHPPPRYLTEPAAIGDVEKTVLASGTLQPLQQIDVGAQVSGQIKSLKVALGDHGAQLSIVVDQQNAQAWPRLSRSLFAR